jgi:lipopolysaccharide transport system ATP-binding protein
MADIAIRLEKVSKFYRLYDCKRDRLREALDLRRRKRHREFFALREIDLEVKKGEILGVVGRNGAGKSTLLKIVTGVIPANSGRVAVHGRVSALLELGAGLNPNLDGIQNIFFGGIMMGFSRQQMTEKLDQIVAFADIGDFIRQPVRTYSTGMRARLGFALAVNIDPEILIVDEVLSVGDELFRRKCYAKMEAVMKAGCTVIFVSHSSNTIIQFCSRVVLLDQGELLLNGPPKTVNMYYLRLLNASPQNHAAIRSEIKELHDDPSRKTTLSYSGRHQETKSSDPDAPGDHLLPFFIPELVSQSMLVQKNHPVAVEDIQLLTEIGERVNVLIMAEEYQLAFKVRFDMDASDVSFGVAIKSKKGANLCNCNLSGNFIPFIEKGKQATVHFYFTCNLLPGSYFVTLNVASEISGQRQALIQIQDALAFLVQAERKMENIGGMAYCHQFLETEIN